MDDDIKDGNMDADEREYIIEEPLTEEEIADVKTKPLRRFGAPALIITAFLSSLIGGGVVWLGSKYYEPPVPDIAPLDTKLEDVRKEITALETENEKMRAQFSQLQNVSKSSSEPVNLDPITVRLERLENAAPASIDPELVSRLEALQDSGSDTLELTDILARLEKLEAMRFEDKEFTALSARVEALENAPVTLQPVATLTAISSSATSLKTPIEFPTEAVLASLPKEGNWLERSLKKHISVQSEENPRFLVELIQKSLDEDDMAAAKAAFDKLPSDAKAAAQAWRDSLDN